MDYIFITDAPLFSSIFKKDNIYRMLLCLSHNYNKNDIDLNTLYYHLTELQSKTKCVCLKHKNEIQKIFHYNISICYNCLITNTINTINKTSYDIMIGFKNTINNALIEIPKIISCFGTTKQNKN